MHIATTLPQSLHGIHRRRAPDTILTTTDARALGGSVRPLFNVLFLSKGLGPTGVRGEE